MDITMFSTLAPVNDSSMLSNIFEQERRSDIYLPLDVTKPAKYLWTN